MGYKFTQEKHGIDIYKVNDQGYISDSEVSFTITWHNELLRTIRNATQIIGKYDSREDCLLEMYFKLKNSHVQLDINKIEEYFQNAKELQDIELLLKNLKNGTLLWNV